ncbi:hypothetical protein H0H87_002694 [Tephrocybe sp. NHM501043]|nr:hypothetical protein H0H87_002694 [Tephrocybe sp. NHM501043]
MLSDGEASTSEPSTGTFVGEAELPIETFNRFLFPFRVFSSTRCTQKKRKKRTGTTIEGSSKFGLKKAGHVAISVHFPQAALVLVSVSSKKSWIEETAMEAIELARWTRFAAKGGIGKCTALCDCVAENADDLMFLKDDEITVLMQLPEPPGVYLGYCEGVVGRFLGTNVRFHSRLKKPIMAKRSSVSASGKSPTPRTRVSIDEHIASGLILPLSSSPDTVPGVGKAKLSTGAGSRRSSAGQEKSDGEPGYGSSRGASPAMPSTLSPVLRPPSNLEFGLGSSTPPIHAATPPLLHGSPQAPSRSSFASSRHISMLSSYSQATDYGDEPKFANTSVDTIGNASFDTITDTGIDTVISNIPPSSPPKVIKTTVVPPLPPPSMTTNSALPISISHLSSSSLYASTSASSTVLPRPLRTSPSPPITSIPSALTNPDTSTSTYFDTSRISLALSDGEVGIGLSLLQDLADGDGWSESDSDSSIGPSGVKAKKGSIRSRGSLRRRGTKGKSSSSAGIVARTSTISEFSRYSNNSSEDGLGYEDTETGHSTLRHTQEALELEANITQTQAVFSSLQQQPDSHPHRHHEEEGDEAESPVLGRSEQQRISRTLGQQMMTFPPVAPLSPSRSRFIPPESQDQQERDVGGAGEGEHFEFPTPPTHTPRMSFSHKSTVSTSTSVSVGPSSPPTSFVRPTYFNSISTSNSGTHTPGDDSRARRPSTVSTTSTPSVAGSDNWDADIYDDYRYSRFSSGTTHTTGARSFSSRMSVGSRAGINAIVAEGMPSVDSTSRGTGTGLSGTGLQQSANSQSAAPALPKGRTRSRSNTTASLNPVVLSPSLPSIAPVFVQQAGSPPPPNLLTESSHQQQPELSPPTSPLQTLITRHRATDSESSGSLYSAQPSAKLDGSFVGPSVPPSPLGMGSFNAGPSPSSNTIASSLGSIRPAPLQLASSNHSSPTIPTLSSEPLSPTSHQYVQDVHLQQQHQSLRSPLLHTGWGSAVSSPASPTVQFASVPPAGIVTSNANNDTPNTGSVPSSGGQAVTGREMSGFFPAGLDALGNVVAQQGVKVREREGGDGRESREVGVEMEKERRIVVEDDDEDDRVVLGRGLVVDADGNEGADGGVSGDKDRDATTTLIMGGRVMYESPSIASSPEPEPEMLSNGRLAPLMVANRTPSPMMEDEGESDAEEMEREKEELRRQAASLLNPPPAPPPTAIQPPPPPSSYSTPPFPPPTIHSPPPVSTPSPVPAVSHLRPTLAEIRPSAERQSLFLPHPNAPKATPSSLSPGPMYIASQNQPPPPQPPNTQRLRGGVMQTIHMALSGQGPPSGPRGRGPTIYGITTTDLSAAMGPVLIHFSVTPPPATAPPLGSVPASRVQPTPPPPPAVAPPRVSSTTSATPPLQSQPHSLAAPIPRIAVRRVGSIASLDVAPVGLTAEMERPASGASGAIPRANFFPKAGGVRPRSRSFSGFQSTAAEVPLPVQRSRDAEDQPAQMPSATEVKRSLSPIIGSPTTPSSSTNSNVKGLKPSPLRVSSPLSRQENSAPAATRPIRPSNSPLMQSFANPFGQTPASSSLPSSPTTTSPPRLLRQTASRSTLSEISAPPPAPRSRATMDSVTTPSPPAPHTPEPRGRPSADGDSASVHSSRSNVISPPPGRRNSLRSKLSLPNLNLRRPVGRQDEPMSPLSPTLEADMLQVQDMDFELVRPNLGHLQGARSSEDSGVMGRDMSVDARQDGSFLRADSPLSLNLPRSPTVVSDAGSGVWAPLKSSGRGGTDSDASQSASMMDAHRQRELKWMTVLGSVQPAQSRKSKKVKKLLFDGVPSSVRYLVWSMLTDGKARCVPGVYAQLGGRGRVAALADVERDVQRCFTDHPQLQSTQGPVLALLQAYLTMVPDVQYVTGLTLIAGHLLLLAPEEDAFWIFVSVMDSHIRPYFSSTSMQVDVDSTLFGRAMDTADPTLAKKLFGDFGLSPSAICRPWFTSLFVGRLPSDYLNRVWDIFLFEGVPFVFRVALVLVSCCRRQIFDAPSADAALNIVLRPNPELLPTSPEALITLALSVKLKDDDLRKQRVKLEAQIKRQTQLPRPAVSTPGSISLPRA